jgi:hypothetical protein
MTSGRDKWIRSIKDNPAGKVVTAPEGNRWEWDRANEDETARLLRKLQNDELAIEQTDIVPNPKRGAKGRMAARAPESGQPMKKRDAGGGFNPYDNTGKPRRR